MFFTKLLKLKVSDMSICYYAEKVSGTSADTLVAIGFASFLGQLCLAQHGTQEGIFLYDHGPYFTIVSPWSIEVEKFSDEQLVGLLIVQPLDSSRQREKQAQKGEQQALDGFKYDEEMEKNRSYRELVRKLGSDLSTPEARLRNAPELKALEPADTRLGHYQAINMMKIAASFNELATRWDRLMPIQKRLHIELLLRLFSTPLNDIASASSEWQKLAKEHDLKGSVLASALQIINPTTGKGANRTKARELMIGNQDSFWLLELLKFRGFMEGAAPLLIQDSDDRKTYIIQPRQMEIRLLQEMMTQFRAVLWSSTAVKLDILASLRFAQVIVQHHKVLFQQGNLWGDADLPDEPTSLAAGFDVTFYKFLGSAYATMNISTIGLPTWLPRLESEAQVEDAATLLDEHVKLVRLLRNSKDKEGAEEYELLHLYRDFLSGEDLNAFWKFTTVYSSYVMSANEKNRFVQLFTTRGLERLLMNNQRDGEKLKPILENEGFKHIANAIRQSTITAQYRQRQLGDRTYDIHYGLGQDLKRKSHRPREFMEALGIFLQKYSEETARQEEKVAIRLNKKLTSEDRYKNKLRANVSDDDIADITELVDTYGSSLICSMLIASGYARRSVDEEA
jgi:hypothetical protein